MAACFAVLLSAGIGEAQSRFDSGRLTIRFGGTQPETVSGRVSGPNTLVIDSVTYERDH